MARAGKKQWHSWIPSPLREHLRAWELKRKIAALDDDYASQLEEARGKNKHQERVPV